MQRVSRRTAQIISALLSLMVAGCASRDGAHAEAIGAPAGAPQTAAAPSSAPAATARADGQAALLPGPPSSLESRAGIQVTKVGLTASGGLVDVRFKVLDAGKVRALLRDPANTPVLIAGDKPPLLAPHHALKGARFSKGQIFFILYPNVRGAVQAGVPVTVAMGPVRLGPVTAR